MAMAMGMTGTVQIKDIFPAAQNNIITKFIILEKARPALEGQNMTCLALVAEETSAVHFLLWGEECEAFERVDIIRLTSGIFSYHRQHLVLRSGKKRKAEKVGEFTMLFVVTPNMSDIKWIPAILSTHSCIFPPMM